MIVYLIAGIVWLLCVWQAMRIAKRRNVNPLLTVLFLLLTGFCGPIGLLIIYIFMPDRTTAG